MAAPARKPALSEQEHQQRQRVLTKERPTQVRSIAEAVVVKDAAVYFLCDRGGQVPLRGRHGLGLYYHDCRYLNGYEIRVAGKRPQTLVATSRHGFSAILELTNLPFRAEAGRRVEKETVGIEWQRVVDGTRPALHDRITFQNYGQRDITFPVALTFRAAFEDLFVVRGLLAEQHGQVRAPAWRDGGLHFTYDGADNIRRTLQVHFKPKPRVKEATSATFSVKVPAGKTKALDVRLVLAESAGQDKALLRPPASWNVRDLHEACGRASDRWREGQTQVQSDSVVLEEALDRSLRDLHTLRTRLGDDDFYAAGVPWFVTLFGRDSILAALQTLAYEPGIAEETLRLLARYQGTKMDDWRDEQPGKILHELRVGELARTNAIPHTPYYGSIDATPLFLILLGQHAAWTGDLRLFHDLRRPVERALEWMAKYGDRNGDGYLEYNCASGKGLVNQGWKDSGNAIVNADGSLAEPPIALVEVQAYAYFAKRNIADLYERAGENERATRLRREADELRQRFNNDFWMEKEQYFALALQGDGKPAAVLSSNPGQALWTGIVDADKGAKVAERLLAEELFNGWGVRTLSERERSYNPIGYHLGTVWPHDNSLIASGLRRYGFDDAARRIFSGIAAAATHFHAYRLPEVFAGFARKDFGVPVRYPVACHPQAWAAGTMPYLLTNLLGLVPDAFEQRLRVVRPMVPDTADYVELHGLRVGAGCTSLRFERQIDGTTAVEVLKTEGPLEVIVDTA